MFASALPWVLSLSLSLSASAKEAPPGMTAFNKTCPAPKACETLRETEKACRSKTAGACDRFVATFEKLVPEYDCHRDFDENFVVPAVWLCGDSAHGDALKLLSELPSPAAKKLFESKAFRASLDGELAEWYRDLRAPKKKAKSK